MIINVKVVPKSSKDSLSWYDKERQVLKLNLRAPAVEGKANRNLIEFFAKFFQIKKDQITIKSGETSKLKLIKLDLEESIAQQKLQGVL